MRRFKSKKNQLNKLCKRELVSSARSDHDLGKQNGELGKDHAHISGVNQALEEVLEQIPEPVPNVIDVAS